MERAPKLDGVEFVRLDVCSDESVREAVQRVLDRAGAIDVLINNAGISLVGPVEATSDEEAYDLFNTNVFGLLRVTRAVLPVMRKRGAGLIVNISSVLGFLPAPFMGLYSSSKHAIEGLSESLDHEVRKLGVRVMLVEPSFTNTKLEANAMQVSEVFAEYGPEQETVERSIITQIREAPPPEDVANSIVVAVQGRWRQRIAGDKRARLLSILRRFVPSGSFGKSLRSSFGLSG